MAREEIRFVHGGRVVTLGAVPPTATVLDHMRETMGLTGTKEGCAEGDCGACTVVLGRLDGEGRLRIEAVNACILLLGAVDGTWLATVEDLGGPGGALHPIQQGMLERHGSQCGFCTPGFVMTMLAVQHDGSAGDLAAANAWLAGNLCRCTGYGAIQETTLAVSGSAQPTWFAERMARATELLQGLAREPHETVDITTAEGRFVAPADSDALADHFAAHPDARLVAGATDVGLWITKQLRDLPHLVWTRAARDLCAVRVTDTAIEIGAAATYAEALPPLLADYPEAAEMFERLGGVQVRNAGTIGGNIGNGSPIGDSPPLLIALGAELVLRRRGERRTLPIEDYFIEYGRQDLRPGEFIESVRLARRDPALRLFVHKISKRRDQDISAVLAAFAVTLDGAGLVRAARLAFGGMAGVPALAKQAMAALVGRPLGADSIAAAKAALAEDFTPLDDHRASAWYRLTVARNLLERFLLCFPEPAEQKRLSVAGAARHA